MRCLSARIFVCVLTVVGGLTVSSCGDDNGNSPRVNPDEQFIRQMITNWLSYLEAGDVGSLESMFDPDYWEGSPTQIEWSDFTDGSLSATDISVAVVGLDATASFTVTMAGEGSMSVAWTLFRVGDAWKITDEDWSNKPGSRLGLVQRPAPALAAER